MKLRFNKQARSNRSEKVDDNIFAENNLFKLKKDFDCSEFYPMDEEFTQVEEVNGEVLYYDNNNLKKKKIVKTNQELLYIYDNKKTITKKITKIVNGQLTDYKVVKYGNVIESTLYRFKGDQLEKKAIIFFKDTYKYRTSIYHIKQRKITGIERITYEKDTQRVKTNTVYKFEGEKTDITFKRYSHVGSIIQTNSFKLVGSDVISIDTEILKSNVIILSAKKELDVFHIKLNETTKYGTIKVSYEAPADNINNAFKFHEGDYNDISILEPDDKICTKHNFQIDNEVL